MIKEHNKIYKYRKEIDGFRAFAVISVIINHINNGILPSGYLGVDIFFVISGYVITLSLSKKKNINFQKFINNFYTKRIKRILPPLAFVVLVNSIIISFFRSDVSGSLKTGMASLFGVSNFALFWASKDYFAETTLLNPFTHTWSLGVEEQFYFLFPFIIWITGFSRKNQNSSRNFFLLIMTLGIFSVVNFIFLYSTNQPAAYFLMPFRFWEIATGCIAFLVNSKKYLWIEKVKRIPSSVILLLIIVCMLLPVSSGAILTISIVILSGLLICTLKERTLIYNLFANKRLIYIGLLSYSLYLWHWPIITISLWTIGIHWWSIPFQITLILIMAMFSYHVIERPFKDEASHLKNINKVSFAVLITCISLAFNYLLDKAFHSYLYLGSSKQKSSDLVSNKSKECKSKYQFLFVGDSHAGVFKKVSKKYRCKNNLFFKFITRGATPYPIVNYTNSFRNIKDNKINNQIIQQNIFDNEFPIKDEGIVIINLRAPFYFYDSIGISKYIKNKYYKLDTNVNISQKDAFKNWLIRLENLIQSNSQTEFVLMSPYPDFEKLYPNEICVIETFRPFLNKNCNSKSNRSSQIKRHSKYITNIKNITAQHANANYLDVFSILCPNTKNFCESNNNNSLERLYTNDNHPSKAGVTLIMDKLIDLNHTNIKN